MLESHFNKVAGFRPYYKETATQIFSCEYCEIFKDKYFKEHLRTAAPGKSEIT